MIIALFILISTLYYPIFSNKLYSSDYYYDFNNVKAGIVLSHVFTVRNFHPWPVSISGISGDCGCTKEFINKIPPFVLYPLESVNIYATFDTSGKFGREEHVIRVITDDNKTGTALKLMALIH